MPGHWGGSSGGGGPAGGASSGGNYGGGGGHHGGGGGQAAQRAAQQAAAQRAMQAQVAAAEKQQAAQQAAQRAEADRQQRVAQQAAAEKAAVQKAKTAAETQSRMSGRTSKSKSLGQALAESPMTLLGLDPDKAGVAQDPSLLELQEIKKAGLSPQKYAEASQYGLQEDLMERGPLGTLTGMGAALAGPFLSATVSPVYDTLQGVYRGIKDPNKTIGQAIADENIWEMTKGRTAGSAKFLADKLGIGNFRDKMVAAITPSTAAAATPGYQNIFQTGAVSQTPGGAYQPPAPMGTGEGLGSINPFEQPGARTAIPRPPVRSRIQDERTEDIRKRALGNIALQTDKSLMDVSDPSGQRQGIMSGLTDMGGLSKYFNPQKMITNFALNKMGLGFLNPLMGLASLFGFNPFKNTGTKTALAGPSEMDLRTGEGQAPANVIQAGVEKFQPTDQQTAQMDEIRRKRMILQGYADKRSLNERGMNTLAQMNQLISQYQADPRSIYG